MQKPVNDFLVSKQPAQSATSASQKAVSFKTLVKEKNKPVEEHPSSISLNAQLHTNGADMVFAGIGLIAGWHRIHLV